MSYACGKRYYVCVTCMLQCSVPLLVSNIHDIILLHTHYELVCTALYSYSFPVPVCTSELHEVLKSVHDSDGSVLAWNFYLENYDVS